MIERSRYFVSYIYTLYIIHTNNKYNFLSIYSWNYSCFEHALWRYTIIKKSFFRLYNIEVNTIIADFNKSRYWPSLTRTGELTKFSVLIRHFWQWNPFILLNVTFVICEATHQLLSCESWLLLVHFKYCFQVVAIYPYPFLLMINILIRAMIKKFTGPLW